MGRATAANRRQGREVRLQPGTMQPISAYANFSSWDCPLPKSLAQIQRDHGPPVAHVEFRSDQGGCRPRIPFKQGYSPADLHTLWRQNRHGKISSFIEQDDLVTGTYHVNFAKRPVMPGDLARLHIDCS